MSLELRNTGPVSALRRGRFLLLVLAALLALGIATQSVMRVSLAQLRVFIAREQLLNYELSSRMLRVKFKRMLLGDEDLRTEVRMKVLESSVLNFERSAEIRLLPVERFGLWIVNGVRLLNLKSVLRLEEDQNRLVRLQYAFHLERTRKYARAAEQYAVLEEEFPPGDENRAFVLLHRGFCLALAGSRPQAIRKLETVETEFSGSHYQENATVLLKILREGDRQRAGIMAEHDSEIDRARALFRGGQFGPALRAFDAAGRLNRDDRYARARSLEELGRNDQAIREYMALTRRGGRVATRANRRLIVIGAVYDGGREVEEFAARKARDLGDTEIFQEVKQVARLKEKPRVIENIKNTLENNPESFNPDALEELQTIQRELEQDFVRQEEQVAALVAQEPEPEPARRNLARAVPGLTVELADGRTLPGIDVRGDADMVIIRSQLPFQIPVKELRSIRFNGRAGNERLGVLTSSGDIFYSRSIDRGSGTRLLALLGRDLAPENVRFVRPVLNPAHGAPLKITMADRMETFGELLRFDPGSPASGGDLLSRYYRQPFGSGEVARVEASEDYGGSLRILSKDGRVHRSRVLVRDDDEWELDSGTLPPGTILEVGPENTEG